MLSDVHSEIKQRQYPPGFNAVFMSEFISKFTFWGIQSLLVLYLISYMKLSSVTAYAVFGVFASMCWAVSILAGYLADKYLGFKRLILYGFIFALFGNILFIFQTQSLFFLGLAFFVFGTGLVIPNNASMIGALYDQDDSGRDKGYGLYYVASNVGGLLGPILFGYLGHYFGWVVSFIVCAISIVLWFILYLRNRHHLASKGNFEGDVKKHIFLPF